MYSCRVSPECPRVMGGLQRSAGGIPLSLRSWSSHLQCSKVGLNIASNSGLEVDRVAPQGLVDRCILNGRREWNPLLLLKLQIQHCTMTELTVTTTAVTIPRSRVSSQSTVRGIRPASRRSSLNVSWILYHQHTSKIFTPFSATQWRHSGGKLPPPKF